MEVHTELKSIQFSSVQSLSRVRLFAIPWIAACQASLSITNSWSSLKLMSIESVMPSSHLILCCPLLLLPPIPPSIRVFSSESTLRMRWPKYWSFSFSIIPSKEHQELISFRMDWLDLLAVQGTLKSLLQHHSSKASILQCSAFFTVQFSHPYIITEKTIVLTRQTFVGKVMSLLLNMLSRLVITFLPRSKHLLISWLQSPSAVILEPQIIKCDTVSPSICHEVMGPDAMILVFWMLSFKPTFSLSYFTFSEVQNPAPPESASQKNLVKNILQALPRALQILWPWVGEQARAPGDRLKAVSCSGPELLARATHWPGPRFRAIAELSHPNRHDRMVVASAWVSLRDPTLPTG